MKREELLAEARKHVWAAWQLSAEELASQAVATLHGMGMLVPEGGAQELEKLARQVVALQDEAAQAVRVAAGAVRERDLMRERVSEPFGCAHCGAAKRVHGRRYIGGVGMHGWERPSDEQVKARMLARRVASMALPSNLSLWEESAATKALRARVAELEAQRDALAARLKRGQEWQPGRTPALVSQDYLSQDELRSIFGIPLVAPWDDTEDLWHPCGCPKRFDRHAWGCPTLPAEDDVTGFFQPGHAYTHHPGPDSPGGPRVRFYCETVTTDRTTGQPVARGWGGRRYGDRWTSVQHTRGLEDWQSGQWVDTPAGGDQ